MTYALKQVGIKSVVALGVGVGALVSVNSIPLFGFALLPQDKSLETAAPKKALADNLTQVFQVYGLSPSAKVIHAKPLPPKRAGTKPSLVTIALDESTRLLSPEGKRLTLAQLMPGMRIRVRGTPQDDTEVLAAEVRLLSRKIYLKPARLAGQVARSDSAGLTLKVGRRTVLVQRWPGGVKTVGVSPKDFDRRGFEVFRGDARVQVRGWFLEDDLVLASHIQRLR